MNSRRARLLSSPRTTFVVCGSEINHIYMKIRNWSKFIMFHRYFKPIARKN